MATPTRHTVRPKRRWCASQPTRVRIPCTLPATRSTAPHCLKTTAPRSTSQSSRPPEETCLLLTSTRWCQVPVAMRAWTRASSSSMALARWTVRHQNAPVPRWLLQKQPLFSNRPSVPERPNTPPQRSRTCPPHVNDVLKAINRRSGQPPLLARCQLPQYRPPPPRRAGGPRPLACPHRRPKWRSNPP